MISDSAVFSVSGWQGEQIFSQDAPLQPVQSHSPMFDMDYSSLEEQIVQMRSRPIPHSHHTSANRSTGTSVASSECSDELCFEYDNDTDSLFAVSEDQEYLNSSFYNLLDVNSVSALSPFDWSDTELEPVSTSLLEEVGKDHSVNEVHHTNSSSSSSSSLRKKRSHSQSLTDHTPWSKMTSVEQINTVEELSKVISFRMGLREQIEVIRIINPSAQVSAADTEFVIDLDRLSDEKLNRVREYVKQHSRNEADVTPAASSSSSSSKTSTSSSPSHHHKPQLTKKQRKIQQKEQRQRQRKEYRQMMKERKSGLFAREEVLSMAVGEIVDSDVDILT